MSGSVELTTDLGTITFKFRPDASPETCAYISKLVADGLYNGACFYRADFVIQFGLRTPGGQVIENRHGPLHVNEQQMNVKLSNTRGALSIAHWDCVSACGTGCQTHAPDCGGAEVFINLKTNSHLDDTWGGYCVFAQVEDEASFQVVDAIEKAKKESKIDTHIRSARLV
eukprot:TRINITY_DN16104_c0_g1_i1.p1 TRINITY_DN16104_c0_g1~~TRINITY_DN16104_c0_g1_i1.p1  ORF type:complete len:170 (+),score=20.12 TRINITY_DN16104_c0_g1_i1:176-685(+)